MSAEPGTSAGGVTATAPGTRAARISLETASVWAQVAAAARPAGVRPASTAPSVASSHRRWAGLRGASARSAPGMGGRAWRGILEFQGIEVLRGNLLGGRGGMALARRAVLDRRVWRGVMQRPPPRRAMQGQGKPRQGKTQRDEADTTQRGRSRAQRHVAGDNATRPNANATRPNTKR